MIAALVLSLAVNAYGVPGTGTLIVDSRGNFTRTFSAGPASEREGWNGRDAWRADATGFARVQGDLAERNEIRGWSRAFRGALFAGTAQTQTASSQEHVRISFSGLHRVAGAWIPQTMVAPRQYADLPPRTRTSAHRRRRTTQRCAAIPRACRSRCAVRRC
jgi:hypothetical protein